MKCISATCLVCVIALLTLSCNKPTDPNDPTIKEPTWLVQFDHREYVAAQSSGGYANTDSFYTANTQTIAGEHDGKVFFSFDCIDDVGRRFIIAANVRSNDTGIYPLGAGGDGVLSFTDNTVIYSWGITSETDHIGSIIIDRIDVSAKRVKGRFVMSPEPNSTETDVRISGAFEVSWGGTPSAPPDVFQVPQFGVSEYVRAITNGIPHTGDEILLGGFGGSGGLHDAGVHVRAFLDSMEIDFDVDISPSSPGYYIVGDFRHQIQNFSGGMQATQLDDENHLWGNVIETYTTEKFGYGVVAIDAIDFDENAFPKRWHFAGRFSGVLYSEEGMPLVITNAYIECAW